MKKKRWIILSLMLSATLFSCTGPTQQNRGTKTGAIIGAAGGALLGQAIGRNTEATLLGAGIGAAVGGLAGNQIGAYMDRQEKELREALAASEAASIQRTNDVLTATFRGEVFFDFDSYVLKPGAYSEISRMSGVLNKYAQTNIRVEGHTDSKGSEDYNQQLSEKRAQAVRDALVQYGVNPTRIVTIGFGETQPLSSSDAMNRRVNVVIIPIT